MTVPAACPASPMTVPPASPPPPITPPTALPTPLISPPMAFPRPPMIPPRPPDGVEPFWPSVVGFCGVSDGCEFDPGFGPGKAFGGANPIVTHQGGVEYAQQQQLDSLMSVCPFGCAMRRA